MCTYASVLLHPYAFLCNNDADKRVEVGWNLWRSSGSPPLHEHGHLQLVAQDQVQVLFGYLQRRRLHHPSGRPLLSSQITPKRILFAWCLQEQDMKPCIPKDG